MPVLDEAVVRGHIIATFPSGATIDVGELTGIEIFRDRQVPLIDFAVEVTYEESRFDSTAHNTDGEDSYGLFQINMSEDAGGAGRRQRFGLTMDRELFEPRTNCRVAAAIWQESGGGWAGWEPWKNTREAALMNVLRGDRESSTDDIPPFITGAVSEAVDTAEPLGAVVEWARGLARLLAIIVNPDWWRRNLITVGGAALILLAVVLANRDAIAAVAS